MKRILSKKGETIAETMVAMMIVAMSLTILAGAIVSAARVNSRIKNADESFINDGEVVYTGVVTSVQIKSGDAVKATFAVDIIESNNGYYYYEK